MNATDFFIKEQINTTKISKGDRKFMTYITNIVHLGQFLIS
jgi:hypothetical protein